MFSKDDIHVEAAKGNLENLQSLLAKNPELVNLIDKMDFGTPLHWAAVYGQAESCKLLLEHGADLKLVDDLGYSSLRWAIDGGEPGIVALLIAHGADVNQKDEEGRTPLDVALRKKQEESVAILREHGAKESGFQDRTT
jgi:ankyrin repeat protein